MQSVYLFSLHLIGDRRITARVKGKVYKVLVRPAMVVSTDKKTGG